jgi:hypothetical protein
VLGSALAAPRGDPNPGVVPPNATAYGKTYGEWAQAWWTWVVAIPGEVNPLFVDTNEAAHMNQSEKVFFLAGALDGTPHQREVTVRAGTPLFVPVINALWWAPDDLATAAMFAEMEGLNPLLMTEEELLRFIAEYSIQAYETQDPPQMSVIVDGRELASLGAYRAFSPKVFELDNTVLLGDLPDRRFVADGYWILLEPLSRGKHTIRMVGALDAGPFAGFTVDVTYLIKVTGGGRG